MEEFEMILPPDCVDGSCPYGVGAVALVSDPANETEYKYNPDGTVTATMLKAEQRIFRTNDNGKYNIYFTLDTIKGLHNKFTTEYSRHKEGKPLIITLEHGGKVVPLEAINSKIEDDNWLVTFNPTEEQRELMKTQTTGVSIEASMVRADAVELMKMQNAVLSLLTAVDEQYKADMECKKWIGKFNKNI